MMKKSQMLITRRRAALLVVLLVSMLAAACSSSGSGNAADDDLKLIVPSAPASWDTRQTSSTLLATQLLVNEPLMAYQADGTVAPNLASSVANPSPTVYEYTLAEGVKFSDGSELTPDDVKFSFELHSADDSTSYSAAAWSQVDKVETSGADKVVVTLQAPDPQFRYTIAKTGIVSKAFYDKHGDAVGTPEIPQIGTGPYLFDRFVSQSETTLVPNPDYRGEKPRFKSITMKVAKDDAARVVALQTGEFDGVVNPPLSQIGSFEDLDGFAKQEAPDLALYRVNFDTKKAPFDDVHVRRAIMHAINRPGLADGVFSGRAAVASTLLPESIMAAAGDADVVKQAYERFESDLNFDLEVARDELKQSTRPNGFDIEVPVDQGDPSQSLIAQTMAQDLAKIGVKVKVEATDQQGFGDAVYFKHTADGLSIDSWNGGSPDPINIPKSLLNPGVLGNVARYDNPKVTKLLSDYQTLDVADPKRVPMLMQALSLTAADLPMVPLITPKVFAFFKDGMELKDFDTFWYLTNWTESFIAS